MQHRSEPSAAPQLRFAPSNRGGVAVTSVDPDEITSTVAKWLRIPSADERCQPGEQGPSHHVSLTAPGQEDVPLEDRFPIPPLRPEYSSGLSERTMFDEMKAEKILRNVVGALETGRFKSSGQSRQDRLAELKLSFEMNNWLDKQSTDFPEYTYEMSKIGEYDHIQPTDPAPFPEHRGVKVSTEGPVEARLFSHHEQLRVQQQEERDRVHYPPNDQFRGWVTNWMLPLEERHLLATESSDFNRQLKRNWQRFSEAPEAIPAKPLSDIPNTYPQATINSFPRSRPKEDFFSTFGSSQVTNTPIPGNYGPEAGGFSHPTPNSRVDFASKNLKDDYRVSHLTMPWMAQRGERDFPVNEQLTVWHGEMLPELAVGLEREEEDDDMFQYSFADRLSAYRRRKAGEQQLPPARWLNWETEVE